MGTATSSVYLILGQLPTTAVLARNILPLCINLIRDSSTIEHQTIQRQLAVKDRNSHSWIVTVKDLLLQYNLSSAFELINNRPSKRHLKRILYRNITSLTFQHLQEDARKKVSLQYFNADMCALGKLHPVWGTVNQSPQDIIRGCFKVRLLTGQYRLQSSIAKQSTGSPLCQLCQRDDEDLVHFLLHCEMLQTERNEFVERVRMQLATAGIDSDICIESDDLCLQLIIDCTKPHINVPVCLQSELETLSRLYCYAIRTKRSVIFAIPIQTQR
jgi:hypothetical protein